MQGTRAWALGRDASHPAIRREIHIPGPLRDSVLSPTILRPLSVLFCVKMTAQTKGPRSVRHSGRHWKTEARLPLHPCSQLWGGKRRRQGCYVWVPDPGCVTPLNSGPSSDHPSRAFLEWLLSRDREGALGLLWPLETCPGLSEDPLSLRGPSRGLPLATANSSLTSPLTLKACPSSTILDLSLYSGRLRPGLLMSLITKPALVPHSCPTGLFTFVLTFFSLCVSYV